MPGILLRMISFGDGDTQGRDGQGRDSHGMMMVEIAVMDIQVKKGQGFPPVKTLAKLLHGISALTCILFKQTAYSDLKLILVPLCEHMPWITADSHKQM